MKIAIPNYAAPDTFVDNVAFTLRAMGHDVFTRQRIPSQLAVSRLGRRLLKLRDAITSGELASHERWLLALTKDVKLDVVLALTQSVSEETLQAVKRRGVGSCIAWWGDTPKNMQGMGLLSEEWDGIFVKDPEIAAKLCSVGLNAHLLHEAMNPEWHRPLAGARDDVVVIAGSMYGFRQFLIRKLVRAGIPVALYGPPPPLWSLAEVKKLHSGRYLVRDEKSRVFGAGAACLNSSPETEGNAINCRAFEIAGAAGLQIYEYRPIIEQCFEPGREILVYRTFDELTDHLGRIRRNPAALKSMRDAAARRAHGEHTYRHRLERILTSV